MRQSTATHGLWLSIFLALAAMGADRANGEDREAWAARVYDGAPWDTTDDERALDLEVSKGAVVLRYADGSYVRPSRRQYPRTCGPSALAMVLMQLRLAHPDVHVNRPRDVDILPGGSRDTVQVGYVGSAEHIMWHAYRRARLQDPEWNGGDGDFMTTDGLLNTSTLPRACQILEMPEWRSASACIAITLLPLDSLCHGALFKR